MTALPILVVLAACGDDGAASDAGMDGGRDAGDAGLDAGEDAFVPPPRDAGPGDAGRDASGWWDEAEWEPLPALPTGCVIERANRPEVLHRAEWAPCGDGCERLLPDPRLIRSFYDDGAWHDGTRGYFWIVQTAVGDGRRVVLLAATDGDVLGAWRDPLRDRSGTVVCQVGSAAVGSGHAAVGMRSSLSSGEQAWAQFHAPIDELGAVAEPVAVLDRSTLFGAFMQDTAVSATTVAVELQPTGVVEVFQGGGVSTLGGTAEIPGSAHGVQVAGNHVFFSEYGAYWRVAYGTFEDPAAVFYEVPSVDVRLFRTDGSSFAWLQCYDPAGSGSYSRVELWTAPYTSDPAELAPRLVREMRSYITYTMGGGFVGYREIRDGPQRVELYDLSDGSRRVFVAPSGATINDDPLYVSATEMLVRGSYDAMPTVFRVQLDSLPVDGG